MLPDSQQVFNWRKASYSATNGECVEIAVVDGRIAVRDSKAINGTILHYEGSDWCRFIERAKRADYSYQSYSP
jgi:hypothetical protein